MRKQVERDPKVGAYMACSRNSKGASGLDQSEERVGEEVSGGGVAG